MKKVFQLAFYLPVLAGVLFTRPSVGQSFERSYERYVEDNRSQAVSGVNISIPYQLLREQDDLSRVLPVIDNTLSDSLLSIRKLGFQSLDELQGVFDEELEKQQILGIQFKGLEDPSSEIQSITLDNMNKLSPTLFTIPQKGRLTNLLNGEVVNKELLLELVGKLNEPSAIPTIRQYTNPGNSPMVKWKAYLALARLGDEQAISTLLSKVSTLEVNTDVVYDILPGLVYTHQKELYDFMVAELYKDDRNCLPADPDQTRPINCAYRILEYLAPHIVDFPLTISDSGDLEVRNYRQALQTAREWFTANPQYQLTTNE